MRKKKEKDYELEQDLFAISKANRRVMIVFLIIMLALWCVPIYSLLKDSLKVHGIENYWYVLRHERFNAMNKTLKYISPAKSFTEALPLGNGSLGAMVYGGVPEEKITLNYDTFWSGTGHTELVKACQKFIEEKVANYKQQIGWSCAWLINLWARLGDGTKANYYYEELLRQSVYNNLFDLHPPLGETEGEREVFQIDGNFGSASAVAEMLLSSEDGKITILPALPESWESGKVKGLLAVGGVEVDIAWKNKKPISISLCSSVDQSINIFYGNKKLTEKIELKKQEQQIIDLHSCEWI